MKLLIDAGNTRIKWGLVEDATLQQEGNIPHDETELLGQLCKQHAITHIWGSLVANQTLRQTIEMACPVPIRWVSSERQHGAVRNHYLRIEEHGSDRWLAILALHDLCPGDVVLASLGTALTVEALTAEGDYLGGLIIPGLRLMLDSLELGTARLKHGNGGWTMFPQTTDDAMATGAIDAMAGAITRVRERLDTHTGRKSQLVLTGGNAPLLQPLLAQPCQIMHNLVISGLLKVSNEK